MQEYKQVTGSIILSLKNTQYLFNSSIKNGFNGENSIKHMNNFAA